MFVIDNLIINALVKEFNSKVLKSRIDRIIPVERDVFVFQLRKQREQYNLLVSMNPNSYRATLTESNSDSIRFNTPLLIQLKKHLESGYITGIEQINFDRIISFKIENTDVLKDKITFYLIAELTGKYSNLILTDNENIVMGSYKTVDISINEERQIIVGKKYYPITNKSLKIDLNELTREKFDLVMSNSSNNTKKFLVNNFLGISSHTAKILIENKIDDKAVSSLNSEEQEKLFSILENFKQKIISDNLFIQFNLEKQNVLNLDFYLTEKSNPDISNVIEPFYFGIQNSNLFQKLKGDIYKVVNYNINKIKEKLTQQDEILKNTENTENFKQMGELLLSNIYQIDENTDSVKLDNFFDDYKPIIITLDSNLSVSDNAQKFFKKYTKLKNTGVAVIKLIEALNQELNYFENVDNSIEISENISELKEIELELINEKYIIKKIPVNKKSSSVVMSKFLNVKSSDGFDILIGKNNTQNDLLTTKFASGNDIWLHTRIIPGSHVVIRTENGQKKVPASTLNEAAILAAKFSKAKFSSNVCVIYTRIKNVRKPPRSKPGFVTYTQEKALYVTPT